MTSNWPLTSTLMQWQAHSPPVNNTQMEKERGQEHMELIEILSGSFSAGKRKWLFCCLQNTEDASYHHRPCHRVDFRWFHFWWGSSSMHLQLLLGESKSCSVLTLVLLCSTGWPWHSGNCCASDSCPGTMGLPHSLLLSISFLSVSTMRKGQSPQNIQ